MNKLVFHKVLADSGAYDIPPLVVESIDAAEADLRSAFRRIVNYVDFEPIYEHDPIFDRVPLSDRAAEAVFEFLDELRQYDLSGFDQDVIGRIYERVIPPEERHALGQYYTPPEVIDLIVRLTVRSGKDLVLDPACGTGGFLVSAYNRLKTLRESEGRQVSHRELLNQLFGIDINRFPAHLCAINLTLRNLKELTRDVHVVVRDFFNVNPGQASMMAEVLTPSGSREVELAFPARVDAIVANPPYIRQELIAEKSLCRKHLKRVRANLNEQSDIYAYFFTHSYEFLRKSGRIGFISSNLWLAVRYGEALQEWMLDRFKILAVIHPWRRVFEGQLVPTCITILEECRDEAERNANLVRFIIVKQALPMEDIAAAVERNHKPWVVDSQRRYRIFAIPQSDLRGQRRWHRFLYAPPIYWLLIQDDRLVRLGDLATVRAGVMTGANDFFIVDEQTIQNFGIEASLLAPIVKSPRDISGLVVQSDSVDRKLFDLHEFTQSVLEGATPPAQDILEEIRIADGEYRQRSRRKFRRLNATEMRVISALFSRGHKGAYRYLLWGIRQGFHARPSCANRRVWFDLGEAQPARLLAPENIRGRPFFPLFDSSLLHGKKLFGIRCEREEDYRTIAGFLNSSVGKLFFETHGRIQRGGLVSLMRYDVEELPVLDPSTLPSSQRFRINSAYEALGESGLHEDEAWALLLELDRAILDCFGLEDRAEEVAEIAKALSLSRQEQKEYEIPVEVERVEKITVPGAVRVRGRRQAALREFT
jgi:type I restriction-modification system DNA methylase subunit